MKKMLIGSCVVLACLIVTGCAAWKEMQEQQAREAAAQEAEKNEKGPIRYFLDHKGNQEILNKAANLRPFDPDFKQAVDYSVSSYQAAVASLQKVAVVQEGVAVRENMLIDYSNKIKKELDQFTQEDEQAAYNDLAAKATAANATENDKKRLAAYNTYVTWGATVTDDAIAFARKRNSDFTAAVVKYTVDAKRIAGKFKKDKLKYAMAVSDGLNALNYLSLAGEASALEADVMAAAKKDNGNLKLTEDLK